jgi:hypothetical protein
VAQTHRYNFNIIGYYNFRVITKIKWLKGPSMAYDLAAKSDLQTNNKGHGVTLGLFDQQIGAWRP